MNTASENNALQCVAVATPASSIQHQCPSQYQSSSQR